MRSMYDVVPSGFPRDEANGTRPDFVAFLRSHGLGGSGTSDSPVANVAGSADAAAVGRPDRNLLSVLGISVRDDKGDFLVDTGGL